MTNIIEAVCNIIEAESYQVQSRTGETNPANAMGNSLEDYIKDAYANTLIATPDKRKEAYLRSFSWLGSKNNPPDLMVKGGEAVEVKKTQSALSSLALNSSYPKAELFSDSPMITKECRDSEQWTKKPLVYAVGHIDDKVLKSLWLVYGNTFAAEAQTYERIKKAISSGIKTIPEIDFSETNELGRVNELDPIGVTNLRIRAMWQLDNPRKIFQALHETDDDRTFELVAIIPLDQWKAFPQKSIQRIEAINDYNLSISDAKVKDPNDVARLSEVKVVKYIVESN